MSVTFPRPARRPKLLLRLALVGSLLLLIPAAGGLAAILALGRPIPWQFHMVAVSIHIGAVLLALALGVVQLVGRKGTLNHRKLGYLWCGLMVLAAVSSFLIDLKPDAPMTFIHKSSSAFSIGTLILLPLVVYFGRKGRATGHRRALLGIYFLLLLAGGLSFIHGRAFGEVMAVLAAA